MAVGDEKGKVSLLRASVANQVCRGTWSSNDQLQAITAVAWSSSDSGLVTCDSQGGVKDWDISQSEFTDHSRLFTGIPSIPISSFYRESEPSELCVSFESGKILVADLRCSNRNSTTTIERCTKRRQPGNPSPLGLTNAFYLPFTWQLVGSFRDELAVWDVRSTRSPVERLSPKSGSFFQHSCTDANGNFIYAVEKNWSVSRFDRFGNHATWSFAQGCQNTRPGQVKYFQPFSNPFLVIKEDCSLLLVDLKKLKASRIENFTVGELVSFDCNSLGASVAIGGGRRESELFHCDCGNLPAEEFALVPLEAAAEKKQKRQSKILV